MTVVAVLAGKHAPTLRAVLHPFRHLFVAVPLVVPQGALSAQELLTDIALELALPDVFVLFQVALVVILPGEPLATLCALELAAAVSFGRYGRFRQW